MSTPSYAAGDTKLVTMANQIARFFESQPSEEAVSGVETHIRKFWDPRMRAKLQGIVASGGQGLNSRALEAAKRLAD